MRPAGLLAFEGRTAARTGVYSYEQAEALFADEELERFRAVPAAWADWERRPPSYRKTVTHWVTSAKGAETRVATARGTHRRLRGRAEAAGPMRWSRESA